MNACLIALVAAAFAANALGQALPSPEATPKSAQEEAAKGKASKEVSKMTTAEKKAFAAELNRQMVNRDNPSAYWGNPSAYWGMGDFPPHRSLTPKSPKHDTPNAPVK